MRNLQDVAIILPFKPSIASDALIVIHPVSKADIETAASSELAVGSGLFSLYAILFSLNVVDTRKCFCYAGGIIFCSFLISFCLLF